jgi:hypothetical protein
MFATMRFGAVSVAFRLLSLGKTPSDTIRYHQIPSDTIRSAIVVILPSREFQREQRRVIMHATSATEGQPPNHSWISVDFLISIVTSMNTTQNGSLHFCFVMSRHNNYWIRACQPRM